MRHALGYPSVSAVPSIQLGVPGVAQPLFLVEAAMDRILPESIPRLLRYLDGIEAIEAQQIDALRRFKAQQLGELKLRNTNEEASESDMLQKERIRWAKRIADALGAPINPSSIELSGEGGGPGAAGYPHNVSMDTGVC